MKEIEDFSKDFMKITFFFLRRTLENLGICVFLTSCVVQLSLNKKSSPSDQPCGYYINMCIPLL